MRQHHVPSRNILLQELFDVLAGSVGNRKTTTWSISHLPPSDGICRLGGRCEAVLQQGCGDALAEPMAPVISGRWPFDPFSRWGSFAGFPGATKATKPPGYHGRLGGRNAGLHTLVVESGSSRKPEIRS